MSPIPPISSTSASRAAGAPTSGAVSTPQKLFVDSDAMRPALKLCGAASYSSLLINAPGPDGRSQLHSAAGKGEVDEVLRLLSEGANAFMRDDDGVTPIKVARVSHHREVTEVFRQWQTRLLHAFIGAAQSGDLEAVKNYAKNTVFYNSDEVTILCAGVSHGQVEVTEFLLDYFIFDREGLDEAIKLRRCFTSDSDHLSPHMDPVEALLRRAPRLT